MYKKSISLLVLFGFLLSIGACVVTAPRTDPPPLKQEIRAKRPGPNYVWISGHWKWKGGGWIWVRGHWVKSRKGKRYVPGHWATRGGRKVWIPGRWVKR